MEIYHNISATRFEVKIEGHLSVLNYTLKGSSFAITHTSVPIELRGRGIAAELAKAAFKFAEDNKLKVIPMCSYINTFVSRYPEYRKFL